MGATIVIADDEAHITCVVGKKLRDSGYEVLTARDGQEALELVRAHRPAVVVTDLQMPRMSGIELALRLRESRETADIPVILLTARGYIVEADAAARTNIRRTMSKPFSAREVLMHVEALLASESESEAA